MLAPFIITLREVFEIMLIGGIVYSFLVKINRTELLKYLYYGAFSAITLSFLSSFLLISFYNSLDEKYVEMFEGITMIVGAIFITTFIVWMKNTKINLSASKGAIFFIPFIAILREGIEIVLFLFSFYLVEGQSIFFPALLGSSVALLIGYLSIKGMLNLDFKLFLNITGILLILFSAGLIARGISELQEARVLPVIKEKVWDINPEVNGENYPLLHEKGIIGSFLKGLFGYNGDPSLLEVVSYFTYVVLTFSFWKKSV